VPQEQRHRGQIGNRDDRPRKRAPQFDKRVPGPSIAAAELMLVPIEWAETQFRAMGRQDAHELAMDLMAAYEGSALLANTMRDASILTSAGRRLDQWIESLDQPGAG
jgi:TetR/AcrR family transcriptional regulator, transcriptional repressor for nem operon